MTFPHTDYPAEPYPGARPDHSFLHTAEHCYLLRPGPRPRWSWRLATEDPKVTDLDHWLRRHGEPSLAERIPILAYGSNACPSKITWLRSQLGLTDSVVVLRARTTGLAAVWATGTRVSDGQRPATLVAAPSVAEIHALWLATPDQVDVLDRCEGRGDRYRLARLRQGEVRTEDDLLLPTVFTYLGASGRRAPLLVDGAPVRCVELAQAKAVRLSGVSGHDGFDADTVDGAPNAEDWPDLVFVYGTLGPTGTAWLLTEPWRLGEPERAHLRGSIYDTGLGWPALRLTGADTVPGWLLRLRDPADALGVLDDYEGEEYRRVRVVLADGRLCWTYEWIAPVDGMTRLTQGW